MLSTESTKSRSVSRPAAATAASSMSGEPLERMAVRRQPGECVIERLLGQRPEVEVTIRQRERPAVFELLGAPQLRQTIGIGPDLVAVARDGSVHVEQRAVSVEHECSCGHRECAPKALRRGWRCAVKAGAG